MSAGTDIEDPQGGDQADIVYGGLKARECMTAVDHTPYPSL